MEVNNGAMITDLHRDRFACRGADDSPTQCINAGEIPPPAPRACFGRDELVERIIGHALHLNPIALVGAGGIGKTSIALTVLHHEVIKEKFKDNRRFIDCVRFAPSCANFLRRLSQVIGAGVENPEDLAPLRPSLTSKETLIVLDNAESVLDLQGTSGDEISAVVEELSQFDNICLCITSRTPIVPTDCQTIEIPTLSMKAAQNAFYRIYQCDGQSDPANDILEQLEFHPLSVTLLATVAQQNKWTGDRLTEEWIKHRTGILQVGHGRSLARTIELSLASPLFGQLGPDARGLLGVVAFFPQGIDENNLDWLFPTTPNRTAIFDMFRVLSITHRNDGFTTMLAPLRDFLRPEDPMSSPLLLATKDRYFARMSIEFNINGPAFRGSRWIVSEDLNTEHLLNFFASVDETADEVWDACANFLQHLRWHKPRRTILRQRIEALPDDHRYKNKCLFELAKLFGSFGNYAEQKELLDRILKLDEVRGDYDRVAPILSSLSQTNRMLGFYKDGIQQARQALGIYKDIGTKTEQARCLIHLASLLRDNKEPDPAKEATSQAIALLPEQGEEHLACQVQRILGETYHSEGDRDQAFQHFNAALAIASNFGWHDELFWINDSLAWLFLDKSDFDRAQAHTDQAKLYAVKSTYRLGRAMELQARVWYLQGKLEEAMYETLGASKTFEQLGAAGDLGRCRTSLQEIEQALRSQFTSHNSGSYTC